MPAMELDKTILKNSANLKAYYRFESGALTTDSSGNSHTLTAISDPAEGTGKFGGGVDLDGNDAYSATDHADFKPTGSFSAGLWIKTTSTDLQGIFQSYSGNNPAGWIMDMNNYSTGTITLTFGKNSGGTPDTDYFFVNSPGTVNDGNWHFVAFTYDGSTIRLYIDGKHAVSKGSVAAPVYKATNYVRVGCRYSTSEGSYFIGSLDDVFLVNGTALSADQIKELYEGRNLGELRPQTGLVGLWHLNGSSTDFSGNNNHGTDTSITYSQANGKFGQGAGFNGSSSEITKAAPSNVLDLTTFTLFVWAKRATASAAAQDGFLMDKQGHATQLWSNYAIRVGYGADIANGKFDFIYHDGTTFRTLLTDNAIFTDTNWHLIVVTYSSGTGNLYFDGSLVKTGSMTGTPVTATGKPFYIGRAINDTYASGRRWNGAIDEPLVFNVAKSASWVRQQYAIGRFGEL